jgi:hypothetical protein
LYAEPVLIPREDPCRSHHQCVDARCVALRKFQHTIWISSPAVSTDTSDALHFESMRTQDDSTVHFYPKSRSVLAYLDPERCIHGIPAQRNHNACEKSRVSEKKHPLSLGFEGADTLGNVAAKPVSTQQSRWPTNEERSHSPIDFRFLLILFLDEVLEVSRVLHIRLPTIPSP